MAKELPVPSVQKQALKLKMEGERLAVGYSSCQVQTDIRWTPFEFERKHFQCRQMESLCLRRDLFVDAVNIDLAL